jgi:hypothetical protein
MEPLFDSRCELVGWIDPGRYIFDDSINWVAYLSGGHAWSAITGNWLGPVHHLVCLDTNGNVVVWNPADLVAGTARPARPARALVRLDLLVQRDPPARPVLPDPRRLQEDGQTCLFMDGFLNNLFAIRCQA